MLTYVLEKGRTSLFLVIFLVALLVPFQEGLAAPATTLPVAATSPADGNLKVRPDTPLWIDVDTSHPHWRRYRRQLELGFFEALLNGVPVSAKYDPEKGRIEIETGLLERYTDYVVELRIKAAARVPDVARERGKVNNTVYRFSFRTGSDLYEPVVMEVVPPEGPVRVVDQARYTINLYDDYGLYARGAEVSVQALEMGPKGATVRFEPFDPGKGQISLTVGNTEAEKVVVEIRAEHTGYGFTATFRHELEFAPGPPASLEVLSEQGADPQTAQVLARVLDVYGNPVPGVTVAFSATPATVSVDPQEAVTDERGEASTSLISSAPVSASVTARLPDYPLSEREISGITLGAPEVPSEVSLKARAFIVVSSLPGAYEGSSYVKAGRNGGGVAFRTYFLFDLSGLTGAQVKRATLYLTHLDYHRISERLDGSEYANFGVYQVEEAWQSDTLSWQDQPRAERQLDVVLIGGYWHLKRTGYRHRIGWDVTAAVQDWLSGSSPNYGLLLRQTGKEWDQSCPVFAGPEFREGWARPVLHIEFE